MGPAPPRRVRLWGLPMLAAALPLVGTLVAFRISVHQQFVPDCLPLVDGCVSISRAARHGLANLVFRAIVMPAAVLQALCWLLMPAWLQAQGACRRRRTRVLPLLGVAAALALVLYTSFLGTDGELYRWLRRYGVVLYFGLSCLGMLIVAGEVQTLARQGRGPRGLATLLVALCAALPLLGLAHLLLSSDASGALSKDQIENITEWWAGVIFTAFFALLAWAWRRSAFGADLHAGG